MRRLIAVLPFVLAGCVASGPAPGLDDPFAFVGTWDCGVDRLVLTDATFSDSRGSYRIRSVTKSDRTYTLRLTDGSLLALVAVTDTGLTRVSGNTGGQMNCRRAN